MPALQHRRASEDVLNIEAEHIPPSVLKCILKSLFVLLSLAFAISNHALSVSYEDEDSSLIDSVQRSDVGHRIRVEED